MGLRLELKNRSARPVKYAFNNPSANSSTWMSRNMIITGMMILLFLLAFTSMISGFQS
jgi:succinate dehydrogenase / fumarate reductase cytochrome b subunit